MKKNMVAFDLDDVIADFTSKVVEWHNKTYSTSFKKEDFTSFRFWEIWGGNEKQAFNKILSFYSSEFFYQIEPIKGSLEGVRRLSKEYELMVITSRPEVMKPETLLWIEEHFPKRFTFVEFTSYWATKEKKDKASVCQKHGVKILIDDYPEFLLNFSKKGKAILFDAPWNRDFKHPRIERARSWDDLLSIL